MENPTEGLERIQEICKRFEFPIFQNIDVALSQQLAKHGIEHVMIKFRCVGPVLIPQMFNEKCVIIPTMSEGSYKRPTRGNTSIICYL